MVDLNSISMIYMKCYKLTCQWGLKQSAVLLHKNRHDGCGQYLFQTVPLNFLTPKKKKNRNKWMEVQQSTIARQMSDVWGDYDSAVVKQYVQGTMTANNRAM